MPAAQPPVAPSRWSRSLREVTPDVDSSDDEVEADLSTAKVVYAETPEGQMYRDLDLSTRNDPAIYRPNPFTIAKSRATQPKRCEPVKPDAVVPKVNRPSGNKVGLGKKMAEGKDDTGDGKKEAAPKPRMKKSDWAAARNGWKTINNQAIAHVASTSAGPSLLDEVKKLDASSSATKGKSKKKAPATKKGAGGKKASAAAKVKGKGKKKEQGDGSEEKIVFKRIREFSPHSQTCSCLPC
jgi:hypothetical protein